MSLSRQCAAAVGPHTWVMLIGAVLTPFSSSVGRISRISYGAPYELRTCRMSIQATECCQAAEMT